MKNSKKFAALVLSAAMMVAMAGCGSDSNTSDAASSGSSAVSETSTGKVAGVDDLPGAKIGVQLGTTGDIYASDYEEEGSTVERYNKAADAVMALKQGMIDCVIIDSQPASVYVEQNDDLKILEEPFADEEYAICVAKDNSELKDKLNSALAELKEDGTFDSIISNYIGENAGNSPYESPADTDRSNGTLKMATNAQFPPYEYYEGEGIVGIDADVAQAICDRLGYELQIEDMEFDSIITAVTTGQVDFGMAGMTVTEDRLQSVDFTDSYATATQVIIVKK
ncbi:MAG: transporter substrate-binding domain-containing protein [Lachnospiraceae bacterium]|nr:transporter substrate-binding domain-containing protein [Lachnospiraceae bacterium]